MPVVSIGLGSLTWTNARLNSANVRDWLTHGGPVVGSDCDSGTASNDPITMNETRAHQLIRAQRTSAEGLQPRVLLDEDAIRWPEGRESTDAELRMHAGLQHLLRSGR